MAGDSTGAVTQLLIAWGQGDQQALDRLTPLVYQELKRLASGALRRERAGHTLQTTALVNEAFERLVDQNRVSWQNRAHFLSIAATMMRRIMVDQARGRLSAKRGGGAIKLAIDAVPEIGVGKAEEMIALDDALNDLGEIDSKMRQLVELRYFGGLKNAEIAEVMGISIPTITRKWRFAKTWLYRYISDEKPDHP